MWTEYRWQNNSKEWERRVPAGNTHTQQFSNLNIVKLKTVCGGQRRTHHAVVALWDVHTFHLQLYTCRLWNKQGRQVKQIASCLEILSVHLCHFLKELPALFLVFLQSSVESLEELRRDIWLLALCTAAEALIYCSSLHTDITN